ncbi:MAG: ATP-dependent helicase, partial [bacterium]|nr:ATP-dependent helicase [bacterium]
MQKKFVISGSETLIKTVIDYDKELNEEQLAVVKNGEGPCLVLAGAGSGKTRTIVYRVAYLIEHGVDPQNILLLTFTNKAAKEMMERTERLLGTSLRGLWGGTFHSVSHRILRSAASRMGFRNNFSILDQDDTRDLIKATLKDLSIDVKARRFPSPAVVQSIISYGRNARMALSEVIERKHPRFLPMKSELETIARLFAEKKREANAMDFDDLLIVLLDLLNQNAEIREHLQNQFKYILVDEYQDTNPIQAELVRVLAGQHQNILVVGDDAQSIYSFRAADIKNILRFPDIFPGAKTFRLETNYRSTPEILSLANDIISKNQAQFSKTLRPVCESFEKPQLIAAQSQMEQAKFIAEMIQTLRDEGVKLEEMAVLFRATHHSQAL